MKQALLIAILTGALCCIRDAWPSDWSEDDTRRQMVVTFSYMLDAATTADIGSHDDIDEQNRITRSVLGRNPERMETVAYFSGLAAINYGVARWLPAGAPRTWFQRITGAVSFGYVGNNLAVGLKPTFGW